MILQWYDLPDLHKYYGVEIFSQEYIVIFIPIETMELVSTIQTQINLVS